MTFERGSQGRPALFQIHLEMEDNLPLVQAHLVAEQVEQAILLVFRVRMSSFIRIRARWSFGTTGLFGLSQFVVKMWDRSAFFAQITAIWSDLNQFSTKRLIYYHS